jgi:muconate cycloisomerase
MAHLDIRLYQISIPLKMSFTHASASRSACDSMILEVSDGEYRGYGEIVLREYVNGLGGANYDRRHVYERAVEILDTINGGSSELPPAAQVQTAVLDPAWSRQDLPIVTAAEGALLDLICRREKTDIYCLLNRTPFRETVYYGGILPLLPEEKVEAFLHIYQKLAIPYLRIKITSDELYSRHVLEAARKVFGDDFDIRVDVNCGWDLATAPSHVHLLTQYGVTLIEEPLGTDPSAMLALSEQTAEHQITYVADESAVTFADVERIAADGTFGMLNLRLAKNGGLLRTLKLAEKAEQAGLQYQLGCHVGETGILSAAGRTAAALMRTPRYVDGSFDDFLLEDNITATSYTFGHGGRGPVIRGEGIGYSVDSGSLNSLVQRMYSDSDRPGFHTGGHIHT